MRIVGPVVAGFVVIELVTILIAVCCCVSLKRKLNKRYVYMPRDITFPHPLAWPRPSGSKKGLSKACTMDLAIYRGMNS